jgi:hypothetical protein
VKGLNETEYYMPLGLTLTDIIKLNKKGWHLEADEEISTHDAVIKPPLKNCIVSLLAIS